eukprot:g3568.t1
MQPGSRVALRAQLAQQGSAPSPQSSSRAHHQRLRWWFSRKDKKKRALAPKIAAALSLQEQRLEVLQHEANRSDDARHKQPFRVSVESDAEAFCGAMRRVEAITKELWRGELGSEKHVRFWRALQSVFSSLPPSTRAMSMVRNASANSQRPEAWSHMCHLLKRLVRLQDIVDAALNIRKAGTCHHARAGCCGEGHFLDIRPYGLDFADHYVRDAHECRALSESRLDEVRFKLDSYNARLSELDGAAFGSLEETLRGIKRAAEKFVAAEPAGKSEMSKVRSARSDQIGTNSEEDDEIQILVQRRRKNHPLLDSDDEGGSSDGELDKDMKEMKVRIQQSHEVMERELCKAEKLVKQDLLRQRRAYSSASTSLSLPSPKELRIDRAGQNGGRRNEAQEIEDDDSDAFWRRRHSSSFATARQYNQVSPVGDDERRPTSDQQPPKHQETLGKPDRFQVLGLPARDFLPPLAPKGFLWLDEDLSSRVWRKKTRKRKSSPTAKAGRLHKRSASSRQSSKDSPLVLGGAVGNDADAEVAAPSNAPKQIENGAIDDFGQQSLLESLLLQEETTHLAVENAWKTYEATLMKRLVSSKA